MTTRRVIPVESIPGLQCEFVFPEMLVEISCIAGLPAAAAEPEA